VKYTNLIFSWLPSFGKRFADNAHVTIWHSDERDDAMVPSGKGLALSYSRQFDDRWLPLARIGYSDGGGGAFLERSVSIGLGYFSETRSDTLGIGLNWGRPSEETFGSGLDDQYTAELYYRFQVFQHMTVTPGIQYLKKPALYPDETSVWLADLRARVIF
jgi:porin